MTLSGIDISHHNYALLRAQGLQRLYDRAVDGFVIAKASEGFTFQDPRFNEYMRHIGESNIIGDFVQVGAYHYARPEYNDPRSEVSNFLSVAGRYAGHMVYALDVEGRALSVPGLDKWCRTWLDLVYKETGVKAMVYCQRSALPLFKEVPAGDYGLWLAAWQKQKPKDTKPWPFMAIWQNAAVNLDTDYFFGTTKQWRKYAGGK